MAHERTGLHFRDDLKTHLNREHSELLNALHSLSSIDGDLGRRAVNLLDELVPHVKAEERTVIPLLSSVRGLIEGSTTGSELSHLSRLGDTLRQSYGEFLSEHTRIRKNIEKALEAAGRAGNTEAVRVLEDLQQHIFLEELVLYPFSLLAGLFAGLRTPESGHSRRSDK